MPQMQLVVTHHTPNHYHYIIYIFKYFQQNKIRLEIYLIQVNTFYTNCNIILVINYIVRTLITCTHIL